MLLIVLILVTLEGLVFINWSYKFYYCYLTNTYVCLDLNDIYYESAGISLWNNLLVYVKISLFKKLKISISKKKKISIVNFTYLLIIWALSVPVGSIKLIYKFLLFFNIKHFVHSIKHNNLKWYLNDFTRGICRHFCLQELLSRNTKIELFNKNFY